MSFEIIGQDDNTVYAPLNTTIDADRDYRDLTGDLDACACGGGMPPQMIPPGQQLSGFYQDEQLTPGMLAGLDAPAPQGNQMFWLVGGLLGAWALWAWFTPHEEYGR